MSSQPIGIFDSGIGGLTVMRAIRQLLPNESLVYFGDTARVPYGNRSADTILRYTEECSTFLAEKNVKAIVIACNTASAHVFPYLKHRFHFPLLGVVEPGVTAALQNGSGKKIGVIGTRATIESDVYVKQLKQRDPTATIMSVACPLFVPLVEEDWVDHAAAETIAKEYLASFMPDKIDSLILGCTHYPLLKPVIGKVLGEKIKLIDSAEVVAASLKNLLEEKGLLNRNTATATNQLYVTDLNPRFETVAKRFLGENLPLFNRISL